MENADGQSDARGRAQCRAGHKRYLTGDELPRLISALNAHSNQQIADIFRLLLLTGARSSEVLGATWSQFDFERGVWTKPGSTTKQKSDHTVPLSAPARQILARLHRKRDETSEYVFPGQGGHRTTVKHAWPEILKAAGITGLRIHDLRHSYASALASRGWSLPVIGQLLGHNNPSTTQRYAHLLDQTLRQATASVSAVLSGKKLKSAKVLPLRGRR